MAESNIYYNESNYINHENPSSEKEVIDSVENLNESNEMICEEVIENTATEPSKDEVKDSNDSTDERVESPTTGEPYSFKCVFCDQVLSASDDPKLLECLHNACGSCIGQKIYEVSDTPELEKSKLYLDNLII